eukprot:14703878-Alexandrium_andersonii.AAC.1
MCIRDSLLQGHARAGSTLARAVVVEHVCLGQLVAGAGGEDVAQQALVGPERAEATGSPAHDL